MGSLLMLQRKSILLIIVVLYGGLSFTINTASAHPGRTAADGCHVCRTNCAKWGEVQGSRHCHGGSTSSNTEKSSPVTTPVSKRTDEDIWKERIVSSLSEYRSNHSGFRERYIESLLTEWNGINNEQMRSTMAALVYRLLPDVK